MNLYRTLTSLKGFTRLSLLKFVKCSVHSSLCNQHILSHMRVNYMYGLTSLVAFRILYWEKNRCLYHRFPRSHEPLLDCSTFREHVSVLLQGHFAHLHKTSVAKECVVTIFFSHTLTTLPKFTAIVYTS